MPLAFTQEDFLFFYVCVCVCETVRDAAGEVLGWGGGLPYVMACTGTNFTFLAFHQRKTTQTSTE